MSSVTEIAPGVTSKGGAYIDGPTATGGDLRRFWSLVWLTSRMEFRLRYHGSILGYAWSLLTPLLLFTVIYIFFSQVIRFGGQIENYAVLLLFNIMLFRFFSESTGSAVQSIVSRERMLRTTEMPPIVVPISVVVTSTLNVLLSLPVAFLYLMATGTPPRLSWLLMPLIVGALWLFSLAVALILSTMYVTFRDLSQIWGIVTQALFYSSPIIYVIALVPESWREIVYINPIAPILTQMRLWIVDPSAPNAIEAGGALAFTLSMALMVVVLAIGLWLFVKRAPRIAELL